MPETAMSDDVVIAIPVHIPVDVVHIVVVIEGVRVPRDSLDDTETLKKHHGDIEPSPAGLVDPGSEPFKIGWIELGKVQASSAVRCHTGTGPQIGNGRDGVFPGGRIHEPPSVGLEGFADPQSNEVVIQCHQTVKIGLIVEGVSDVLEIFP